METKECQFCLSQIPEKAQKCKNCLEWQTVVETAVESTNELPQIEFEKKFPNAQKPFQLLIVEKLSFYNAVSVLIFTAIIFFIIQVAWIYLKEENIYLISLLVFILQLAIIWYGLIWIYKLISRNYLSFIKLSSLPTVEAEEEFLKAHTKIFKNRNAILVGALVGLIAGIGDFMIGTPFNTMEAKYLYFALEFLNMFFAGAAIYSVVQFAIYLYKMTSYPINTKLNIERSNAISDIGRIHLKSTVLAIVPLFLGVVYKLIGVWNWDVLIIAWYVVFAVIIVIYIYWPMVNIHDLMKRDINYQVSLIQDGIENQLLEINHNPSSRNFLKLNELRDLEDSISSQNTWPFDMKSLSAAFIAIIFPILLILFDKVFI
jgi:hypothetical protein